MSKNKVIVIGLDGATFDLITPWVKDGKLPALKKLMDDGSWGTLESTPFPNSAPAWVSCLTGVNPGKHGIFGFGVRSNNKYEYQLANTSLIETKTIMEILTEYGKRSIVMNVPVTYPPIDINGIIVSGMETPGKESNFTFPSQFKEEILTKFPNYVIEVPFYKYNQLKVDQKRNMLDAFLNSIDQRKELILSLIKEEAWNFFMIVFSELDRIQHYFWGYMDRTHPLYQTSEGKIFRNVICQAYVKLDSCLEEILNSISSDNFQVFVISDHGFGPCSELFYLNSWLLQKGYLHLNSDNSISRKIKNKVKYNKILSPIAGFARKKLQMKKGSNLTPGTWRRNKVENEVPTQRIDWTKTTAFADEYGVRINMKNREPNGIVAKGKEYETLKSKLTAQLMNIQFENTGEQVFEKILPKEQVYSGPMLDQAPDLVTFTKAGGVQMALKPDNIFGQSNIASGAHQREGIVIAYGQGIRHGRLRNSCIYDIAPTALAFLGVPQTPEMDGSILTLSDDKYLAEIVKQIDGTSFKISGGHKEVYSAKESEIIKENLKGLGYL